MISEKSTNLLDDLFVHCIPNKDRDVEQCSIKYNKLSQYIDPTELNGDRFIIGILLDRYYYLVNESTMKVPLTTKQLERVVYNNGKKLIRSKQVRIEDIVPDIDKDLLNSDADYENQVVNELLGVCTTLLDNYIATETETDFDDTILEFKTEREKDCITDTLHTSLDIFFKGKQMKKEYLHGVDVKDYLKEQIAILDKKFGDFEDGEQGMYMNSLDAWDNVINESKNTYKRITDTGISPIDKAFNDFHASQLLTISGMPGVGKSRLAARILYRAMVNDKRNIYYWSGEQGKFELQMYFLAQHLWNTREIYIDDAMLKLNLVKDDNTVIPDDKKLTEEDMIEINNAKLDLIYGGYGFPYLDTGTLYVEDFMSKMMNLKKIHSIDVFCVDYLLLLSSNGRNPYKEIMNKTQMLEYFMDQAKKAAKKLGMFGMVLNQLKPEEIKSLAAGKEAQVTGSKYSSAPTDFADFNIVLSNDEALYDARKLKFHCPKVRSGRRFKSFIADENAGVCDYTYIEDEEDDIGLLDD